MTATCMNGIYTAPYTSFYAQPGDKIARKLSFFQKAIKLPTEYTALRKDGYHVRFKQTQKIAWEKAEDDYVSLSFEPLNVHAVGENRKETIQEFWDELAFVWRNYALADDSELTQDAIELKHRAQKYLTEE